MIRKKQSLSDKKFLFNILTMAMKNAYSPYSRIQVGALVVLENGQIFSGCNIENASYGATVCAERVAIWKAISASGDAKISEIFVITKAAKPWSPCGLCRQVIAEFATAKTKVHLCNTKGVKQTLPFKKLFPFAFLPKHLGKKN